MGVDSAARTEIDDHATPHAEDDVRTTLAWRRLRRSMARLHVQRDTPCRDTFQRFGGKDWILAHRIKKWRFAGKTARRNDNRWTYRLLNWTPCHGLGRKAGRPHTRWADDLCKFAGSWTDVANDVDFWSALEVGFAEKL